MRYLSLICFCAAAFFCGIVEARGGGGGGERGGMGGNFERGPEVGVGAGAGVGGVGVGAGARPNGVNATTNAYNRGMEAGAVDAGSYGGYYGPWDENYNAFPAGDQTDMDNGEQIYQEDEDNRN